MFPDRPACEAGPEAIEQLVALMERPHNLRQNHDVPAGFTYLAQFVDHDITFDPTTLADREGDPQALENFRTPRLDLDSVYGLGPAVQPYLYDWTDTTPRGTRLLVGCSPDGVDDLPRNQQGRALVGDPRNDEHAIVSQLHLLFIRFHNAVVDHLVEARTPGRELFERARRSVRRHYRHVVAREFLPAIAGQDVVDRVLAPGGREFFTWDEEPFIPVEFSGAAYRFGHSMVRTEYGLARLPPPTEDRPPMIRLFPDLAGHTWLAREHVIDWERFFDLGGPRPQPSMSIDTAISPPLFDLPDRDPKLARRTLLRGRKLALPSGQEIAGAMHEKPLDEADLKLEGLEPGARDVLRRSTPLWYYLLCEAEKGGGKRLGPVGGRIVAEVILGLLEADADDEPWRPGELGTGEDFTVADLVAFAGGG